MHVTRYARAAIAAATLALTATAPAAASQVSHQLDHAGSATIYGHDLQHRHHRVKHHKRHTKRHKAPHSAHKTAATIPASAAPTSNYNYGQPTNTGIRYTEASDMTGCANPSFNVIPFLQAHDANILRVVLTPAHAAQADDLACVQQAEQAGDKVYLTLAFDSASTPQAVEAYVNQVRATYGPVWAVALGNEQTLSNPWLNQFSESPTQYVSIWDAVEPTLTADNPGAIRVLADASPWDANWLHDMLDDAPTGAQAVAFHCYDMQDGDGLAQAPQVAQDVQSHGLPLWCSEMAPDETGTSGAFVHETPAQLDTKAAATFNAAPNIQMRSWYEWPAIGATTPGIGS